MIRHMVMFQFKEEAEGRTRAENVALIREMLDALPGTIPWIRASHTALNAPGAAADNYDLVLVADFDTLEDLERYQVHPAHQAVGARMRPLRLSRACVDFEL